MSGDVAALLEERLATLREQLPDALDGDETAVHDARVASRRLREILPLLVVVDRRDRVPRAEKAIRRVTRALGPVREIDVALGHLAEHAARHPDAAAATEALRDRLEGLRAERRDALGDALDADAVAKLWRRTAPLAALAEHAADAELEWRAVLARRIRSRGGALRGEIERAGLAYDAGALHAVRIATKKLRYAVELAGALRLVATADALRILKRQQESLGRIHDLEVLAELATEAGQGELDATRLVSASKAECHALHARYLRSRTSVLRVTDLAGSALATQVAGARPGSAPSRVAPRAATPSDERSAKR